MFKSSKRLFEDVSLYIFLEKMLTEELERRGKKEYKCGCACGLLSLETC